MPKYVVALDQGTTSSRAMLVDANGCVVDAVQNPFPQVYPQPGWVEHDPRDILSSQLGALTELLVAHNLGAKDIDSIGITNQRETTVVWNRETGEPVMNAIVWQCRRTAPIIDELTADPQTARIIADKTGLVPDAYFSASKIKWILDHVEGAREDAEAGKLAFGTVDTWLIWTLTQGKVHATDVTNASRTMLYNIHELRWDPWLLDLFDIPESLLPEVLPSSGEFGRTASAGIVPNVPICGVAGDQQAALFALEGSVFMAGALMQWLRDDMGIIDDVAETSAIARSVNSTDGVYVVPAFTGLGAPYWDADARGAIYGLTRGTGRAHIVRAALESLAYQVHDLAVAMEADAGVRLSVLNVDGGASANDFLMQFQSDILRTPLRRPQNAETTALGAAFLAGLATGFWKDAEALCALRSSDDVYEPGMEDERHAKLLEGWARAVKRTMSDALSS